jgi:hypothetical protein
MRGYFGSGSRSTTTKSVVSATKLSPASHPKVALQSIVSLLQGGSSAGERASALRLILPSIVLTVLTSRLISPLLHLFVLVQRKTCLASEHEVSAE